MKKLLCIFLCFCRVLHAQTLTITCHNNGGLNIDALQLYISAFGCSAGFFAPWTYTPNTCGSGELCVSGTVTITGGNTAPVVGSTLTFCSGEWTGGFADITQDWYNNGTEVGTSVVDPSGTVNYDVYFFGGHGGGTDGPVAACVTNMVPYYGSITVQNSSTSLQYYRLDIYTGGCADHQGYQRVPDVDMQVNGEFPTCLNGTFPANAVGWVPVPSGQSATLSVVDYPVPIVTGCSGCVSNGPSLVAVTPDVPSGSPTVTSCGLVILPDLISGSALIDGATVGSNNLIPLPNANNTNVGVGGGNLGVTNNGATNNILWAGTNGVLAQNIDLEQGFSANLNALNAIDSQLQGFNKDVDYYEQTAINQRSNLIYIGTLANGYLTNLNNSIKGLTNGIQVNGSNVTVNTGNSNSLFGITNFPTNYPDFAAISQLTGVNSNLASILDVLTNTNGFSSDIVGLSNSAVSLIAPAESALNSMSATVESAKDAVAVYGGGAPADMTVALGYGVFAGHLTANLDPASSSSMTACAAFTYALLKWAFGIALVTAMLIDIQSTILGVAGATQIQAPKIPLVGGVIGGLYVIPILLGFAALIVALTSFIVSTCAQYWAVLSQNVFSGSGAGEIVLTGLYILNFFAPVSFILVAILSYVSWRILLPSLTAVAVAVKAVFLGSIVFFCVLRSDAQPWECNVRINNLSGTNVTMNISGSSPGIFWLFHPGSFTIRNVFWPSDGLVSQGAVVGCGIDNLSIVSAGDITNNSEVDIEIGVPPSLGGDSNWADAVASQTYATDLWPQVDFPWFWGGCSACVTMYVVGWAMAMLRSITYAGGTTEDSDRS